MDAMVGRAERLSPADERLIAWLDRLEAALKPVAPLLALPGVADQARMEELATPVYALAETHHPACGALGGLPGRREGGRGGLSSERRAGRGETRASPCHRTVLPWGTMPDA